MNGLKPERAKKLIKQLSISRQELASKCGINHRSLNNALRDSNPAPVSGAVLILLAQQLKTTTDYLTGKSDDPAPIEAA